MKGGGSDPPGKEERQKKPHCFECQPGVGRKGRARRTRSRHFREIPCGGTELGFFLLASYSKTLNRPSCLVGIIDHFVARLGKAARYISAELGVGVRGGKGVTHQEDIAFGRYGLRLGGRKPDRPDRQNEEDESFHRLEIQSQAETVRTGGEVEG